MAQFALKEMSRHGRLKVGTFVVEFSTPGIGQILRAAGCEYVLLDMEHSGFGFDTLKQMLRYMQAGDMPAIVPRAVPRVPPCGACHGHGRRGNHVADGGLG